MVGKDILNSVDDMCMRASNMKKLLASLSIKYFQNFA